MTTIKYLAAALLAGVVFILGPACSGETSNGLARLRGTIDVRVDTATGLDVEYVDVAAAPARASFRLQRNPEDGSFFGVLQLPAGQQTLTATAYGVGDAVVASGTIMTIVVAGRTSIVRLTLYTEVPPAPDHGPIITSLTVPKTSVLVGEQLEFTATGIDPDGDPVSWLWESSCPERLLTPTDPSTLWSAIQPGTCVFNVTLTSNGLSDSVTFSIASVEGDGTADVTVAVLRPSVVGGIRLETEPVCDIARSALDATCRARAAPGQRVSGRVEIALGGSSQPSSIAVFDDCGGSTETSSLSVSGTVGTEDFTWTAPQLSGVVCLLTGRIVDATADQMAVSVLVDTPTVSETFAMDDVRIASYRDGKRAAASYTWDDGTASSFALAALFESIGMRASFYIIPGAITDITWARWRDVVARGHEVGNHSMSHLNLGNALSEETLSYEIEGAQRLIEEKLGVKPDVFVFPYSSYNALSAAVALRSHLATRNAGPFFAGDGYRVLPLDSGSTTAAVNAALADAITAGAWFVTAGHGIDGNGFQPVTSQFLSEHLAFAAERQSELWVDTFRNVALYRIAREYQNVHIAAVSARAASLWLDGMLDEPLRSVSLTVELPVLRIPGAIRVRDALGRERPFVVANGVLRTELRQGEAIQVEIED